MDTHRYGRSGQGGSPDPSLAPSGRPPLPAHWSVDRRPDGSWRLHPDNPLSVRLLGIGMLVGLVVSAFQYLGPNLLGTIVVGLVLVPLILLFVTWSDEWIVRRGRVEQRSCRFGIWNCRSFCNGSFSVAPSAKAALPKSPADSSPFGWQSGVMFLAGLLMMYLATTTLKATLPFETAPVWLQGMSREALERLHWLVFFLGLVLSLGALFLWLSARSSSTVPRNRVNSLWLRSGLEEVSLPLSKLSEGTREMNALAAWLSQQTGWPVSLAETPARWQSGFTAGSRRTGDQVSDMEDSAFEPGVEPALPEGWKSELQPDGAVRVVPGFVVSQRLSDAALIIWIVGILLAVIGPIDVSWPLRGTFLALAAFVALILGRGEAWILDHGRFDVHRRSLWVWRRRQYRQGTIVIRPRPYSESFRLGQSGVCSYLYLLVLSPGEHEPQIVDLMANNRRTDDDPGWVPSVDELRALAAWLSQQTGWPVQEIA